VLWPDKIKVCQNLRRAQPEYSRSLEENGRSLGTSNFERGGVGKSSGRQSTLTERRRKKKWEKEREAGCRNKEKTYQNITT